MSSPSSPPLILDVGVRRAEGRVAYVAIAAAVLAPLLFDLQAIVSILVSAIIACVVCIGLRRMGWVGASRRIVRVSWLADGRWMLSDGEDRVAECDLCRGTRAAPGLVWLHLRSVPVPRRNFYMLLTRRDGLEDALRRLVVRLRLDAARPPGRAPASTQLASN